MRSLWAITRREIQAYFVSPIAYAFMTVFLLVIAVGVLYGFQTYLRLPAFFMEQKGLTIRTSLIGGRYGLVTWMNIAIMFSLPGLAMRLFTEERKQGTAELLFTSPLTTTQLVVGKYLGAAATFFLILVLTLPVPLYYGLVGRPEWAAIGAAYFGLFLDGCVILALGLFASTLTENQFVALILTYVMTVALYIIEFLIGVTGSPLLDDLLVGVSVSYGLRWAALGVLDSHWIVLTLIYVFVFLFLSGRVIDSARWR